jgi:Mn2+/Fe2+ NRAMP family transporter
MFAFGLIGCGALALPVLHGSAAYAVADARRLRSGLDRSFGQARRFYGVMIASTAVGVAISFVGINPFRALFVSALIDGLLAPPLLVLLMVLANSGSVIRGHRNGWLLNSTGWATTLVMGLVAVGVVLTGFS